jgi:hypothetical protein
MSSTLRLGPDSSQTRDLGDEATWRQFSKRAAIVAALLILAEVLYNSLVRATSSAQIWSILEPWTARATVLGTGAALVAGTSAAWAWVTRPMRRSTHIAAVVSLTMMFPAASVLNSNALVAPGVRALCTLAVLLGVLVIVQITGHLIGRVLLAGANELVRRRGGDGLEKALDAWLEPQTDMQKIAVAVGFLGASWLFSVTFLPNGFPSAHGVLGVLGDVGDRLLTVGDGLALGAITGAAVLWLQSGPTSGDKAGDAESSAPAGEATNRPGHWLGSLVIATAGLAVAIAASHLARRARR